MYKKVENNIFLIRTKIIFIVGAYFNYYLFIKLFSNLCVTCKTCNCIFFSEYYSSRLNPYSNTSTLQDLAPLLLENFFLPL